MLFVPVKQLGYVFFKVDPCDSDRSLAAVGLYFESPVHSYGLVVLGDLVAFMRSGYG